MTPTNIKNRAKQITERQLAFLERIGVDMDDLRNATQEQQLKIYEYARAVTLENVDPIQNASNDDEPGLASQNLTMFGSKKYRQPFSAYDKNIIKENLEGVRYCAFDVRYN